MLYKFGVVILILAIWFYFIFLTPKWVERAWKSLVNLVSNFSFNKLGIVLLSLLQLLLKGLLKLFNIVEKVLNFILYNVPISLSFVFILPCLVLGLEFIFRQNNILLGLACLLCTYLLIRINKDMQGGK